MKAIKSAAAIALIAIFALAPLGAQSAAATSYTIPTCDIPLNLYTQFGEKAQTDFNVAGNGGLEAYRWLAYCDRSDNVYNIGISTTPTDGSYWDYINAGGQEYAAVQTGVTYRFYRWNSTTDEYMYSTDLGGVYGFIQNYREYADSNITLKTNAFNNAGIEIPIISPTPDLTNDISLNWEVTDKHIKVWNSTKIPPLDLSTMSCYWWIGFNDPDLPTIDEKITACNIPQEFDISSYTTIQVNNSILYDKDKNGIITYEESIADIQKNIIINGQNYSGGGGVNWTEDNMIEICWQKTEPYLYPAGCVKNIDLAIKKMLAGVGAIQLPQAWTLNQECRTLGTLGNWLNVPSKTVCAQFPPEVRNIITGALSLGLGLTIYGYILKRMGNNDDSR